MKKNFPLNTTIVLVLLSLLSSSCTRRLITRTPKSEAKEQEITSQQEVEANDKDLIEESYRFDDLPIPLGFKLDRTKSFIFETATIKAGKLVYKGSETIRDLTDFYKTEMPNHEWDLINIFEDQTALINFSKEGWTCSISIYKIAWSTYIEIKIGPN